MLFKVGMAKTEKLLQKKVRQEKLDLLQKGKYKQKRQNPLTELDEESVVNGLLGIIEITLLITARKLEGKAEKVNVQNNRNKRWNGNITKWK